MVPKHGLDALQAEETLAKRLKNRSTPASRSATPAEIPFSVQYPSQGTKHNLTKKELDVRNDAELRVSPFVAKGASKKGESDQYYTVIPTPEWEAMRKYNFINKWKCYTVRWDANGPSAVQGEVYKNHHSVYVRGRETPGRNVERERTSGSREFCK
jgi:hypothetical protein